MTRKCIYTGKEAGAKDYIVPKSKMGDEIHNWANAVPISLEYKAIKRDRMPNELELKAFDAFMKLETAKMKVLVYESRLKDIQTEINKIVKKKTKKVEVEVEAAYQERRIEKIEIPLPREDQTPEPIETKPKSGLWG